MLKPIRTILTPPVFPEDEDKTRKARYVNAIAIAFLGIAVVYEILLRASYTPISILDLAMVGLLVICTLCLVALRRGYVRFAAMLLVILVWVASNGIAANGYGARDSSYLTNFAIILMAGLLLGWKASLTLTIISVISGFALAYAEQSGAIKVTAYSTTLFVRDMAFVFGLTAVLIYYLIDGLEDALKKSRSNLRQLATANASLSTTQVELQNRTGELTIANEQLENRTRKLHAVAEVTRTAASIRNFNELLPSITSIISRQLGYYHVGLFLLDEQRQFAILRSANTEAGLRMLSRGYRLPVGEIGLVGFVAQKGQPQIALDTAGDAGFSPNPDLPDTRSAMALPLKSGNQLIGVLDLQSTERNAFTEEDLSTLSILADQIGIAIENALLYEQSQRALQEANIASLQASDRAWKSYTETLEVPGYRYDGIRSEPLRAGQQSSREGDALFIPVQLRGQTIGRLKLKASDASRQWTDDELAMVEATAERVALALESARLLEEAQKRATRETFLSDVAAKLSTSFQLDSILRDTVEELGQTLKHSMVTFQLVNPAESIPVAEQKSNGDSAVRTQE